MSSHNLKLIMAYSGKKFYAAEVDGENLPFSQESAVDAEDVSFCSGSAKEAILTALNSRDMSFGSTNNPFSWVTSGSFQLIGSYIFYGSSCLDSIDRIAAIVEGDSGVTGQIRIYDYTNGNVICSASTTSQDKQILTFSAPQNVPSSEAIFEVQARRLTGNGNRKFYVLSVEQR